MTSDDRPLAELRPSKVIAVHLNYRSRAEQRRVHLTVPSYFLKPPSSVAPGGGPVVRPRGCELMVPEGEIALVIGSRARNVDPLSAWAHIGWVTAANDFGVHDFRWADRGSNLMAKGQDGFTPVGPRLVAADTIDPSDLTLRTRVNGRVTQEDSTANLIFPFGAIVADLSRFVTLELGDLILTGTPAGASPVAPGDVVEVEVDGIGTLRSEIVSAETELSPYGAMPKITPPARAIAFGGSDSRPVTLSAQARAALLRASTASLSVQLARQGFRNVFLTGLRPARPDLRLLGYAHTLRYVAAREDIRPAAGELNAQKAAIERLENGDVLVIEARGETGAGTIGDILALRALRRGATGIVTDGGARDCQALSGLGIPTYYRAPHAAALGRLHHPLEDDVPVTCAGVLVMPGDVIVGDSEGVVVIPAAYAETVARDSLDQDEREAWALERVDAGESIRGVYPIGPEREPDFESWRRDRRAT